MIDSLLSLATHTRPSVWILIGMLLVTSTVFAVMLYSLVQHHKTHPTTRFHPKIMVEIGWTVVPLLILVITAYPAVKLLVTPPPLTLTMTHASAH